MSERPKPFLDKEEMPPQIKQMRYCQAGKHYTPYLLCPDHRTRTVEVGVYEEPI